MSVKQSVKRILPSFIWQPISEMYWWWKNRGNHQAAAILNPALKRSTQRLESYRDLHLGKRCFILGNGPSLKNTDLSLLDDEITFGLNRIYLLFDESKFQSTYLVSVNTLVIEQCAEEIQSLEMPKFLTWRARNWLSEDENIIFLDTDYTGEPSFSKDMTRRVFEGSTVTYVALQLAYYMGFEEVILIGVDHNFKTQGTANEAIVSEGDDPNHFAPNYFGKGFRWQLPDLEASEIAYRLAKETFEAEGRKVVDATIGGKLDIFPRVDFQEVVRSEKSG
jgi:hypothetical protein